MPAPSPDPRRGLFLFAEAQPRHPAVEAWFAARAVTPLGALAAAWFQVLRSGGPDVRDLLHDGHPAACIGEAAFAYVNVFSSHVNLGFYRGAELPDPEQLLQGTGRLMRHVKLQPGVPVDDAALRRLISAASEDMRRRIAGL